MKNFNFDKHSTIFILVNVVIETIIIMPPLFITNVLQISKSGPTILNFHAIPLIGR